MTFKPLPHWEPYVDAVLAKKKGGRVGLRLCFNICAEDGTLWSPMLKQLGCSETNVDGSGWRAERGPAFPLRHKTKLAKFRGRDELSGRLRTTRGGGRP